MTAETYEIDIADKIYSQVLKIFCEFIPLYAVACKDPFAHIPENLDNYFIMVKTGRIVVRGPGKSTIAEYAKPFEFIEWADNLNFLKSRLNSGRPPTIYESYLLEAARQVEVGASNLAIVQTVMILDWFANSIIEHHLFNELKRSLNKTQLYELTIERIWETKESRHIRVRTEDQVPQVLSCNRNNTGSKTQRKFDETYKAKKRNRSPYSGRTD